jgi:hypothetical protein
MVFCLDKYFGVIIIWWLKRAEDDVNGEEDDVNGEKTGNGMGSGIFLHLEWLKGGGCKIMLW